LIDIHKNQDARCDLHLRNNLQYEFEHALRRLRRFAEHKKQRRLAVQHVLPQLKHNDFTLLHSAPKVGIVELDPDGRTLNASRAALAVKPRHPLRLVTARATVTCHCALFQVALELLLESVVVSERLLEQPDGFEATSQCVLE